MSQVGQPERITQNRIAKLFQKELKYRHLGNWQDRAGNSNIEEDELRAWLLRQGHDVRKVDRVLDLLRQAANKPQLDLYEHNRQMYSLLRYGVQVKVDAGDDYETIPLINWGDPTANDFAIAEEVTLARGGHDAGPTWCCMSTASPWA